MKIGDVLYRIALLIVLFILGILLINLKFDLFRYDRFFISTDIFRYFAAIIVMFFTGNVIKKYSIGNNLIFVPTLVFCFLFFILVFPGVIITAPEDYYGNIAAYGYILSVVAFNIGVIWSSKIFKFRPNNEIELFYKKSNSVRGLNSSENLWALIMTVISVIIVMMTGFGGSGMIKGIISFLREGLVPEEAMNVREARLIIYKNGIGMVRIIFNYVIILILPIVSMTIILNAKIKKKKISIIGVALILFTALTDIGTGQRRLIGYLILYVIISLSFIKKIKLKRIIKYFSFLFVIYILQTITLGRMKGDANYLKNLIMSFHRVFERAFLTKGGASVHVFKYFPEISNFRYGSTMFQRLLGSLSNKISLAAEMHYYLYGRKGTAGPQTFGEAYANFGFAGMIIFSLLVGLLVQTITVIIVRKKISTSNSIAISAFISLLFGLIGYSDFMVFKANGIHILLIYVFVQWLFINLINKSTSTKLNHL